MYSSLGDQVIILFFLVNILFLINSKTFLLAVSLGSPVLSAIWIIDIFSCEMLSKFFQKLSKLISCSKSNFLFLKIVSCALRPKSKTRWALSRFL